MQILACFGGVSCPERFIPPTWIRLQPDVDSTGWMGVWSQRWGGPSADPAPCAPAAVVAPVGEEVQRRRGQVVHRQLEQEPLAVAGHVVVAQIRHHRRNDAGKSAFGAPGPLPEKPTAVSCDAAEM